MACARRPKVPKRGNPYRRYDWPDPRVGERKNDRRREPRPVSAHDLGSTSLVRTQARLVPQPVCQSQIVGSRTESGRDQFQIYSSGARSDTALGFLIHLLLF